MKILHLSDVHFQIDVELSPFGRLDPRQLFARVEFIGQGRPARFREAGARVAEILRAQADADHLLVSGDLTAIGMREELQAARAALAPFEGRLTVIPGNHDRTSKRSAPWFAEVFAAELRSELPDLQRQGRFPVVHLVGPDAAIIGLDSGRVPRLPGLARGRVGRAQLEALEQILLHPRLAGRGVVVAVHHAPFRPDGTPDKATHGLDDATELLAILDRHRVAALCHGHIHQRYRIARAPSAATTLIIDAGSSTQRGREGYAVIEVDGSGLRRAELRDL